MRDRLAVAEHFAGRREELLAFQAAMESSPPPFAVLFVHGPGGIGKSTLLREYANCARAAGRMVVALDARHVEPTPAGLLRAVCRALEESDANAANKSDDTLLATLATHERLVLLLDTYESFGALDAWVRGTLLPQLPADALVVLAGRQPPSNGWITDGAWRALLRVQPLRNLSPNDSDAFLAAHGFAPARRRALRRLTHGHPLALSLFADVWRQSGRSEWSPEQSPHVVKALLERFVQEVPSAHHRLALHASAVTRTTTESLLRVAVPEGDAHMLFEWLRARPFIEESPFGLHPHDLVRDLLDHDLRWRDPATNSLLHDRLRAAIMPRVRDGDGAEQTRAMYDLTFLHRFNPVLGPYFAWQQFGTCTAEPLRGHDTAAMFACLEATVGQQELAIAKHWHARYPSAWYVVRDDSGQLATAFMYLDLHATTETDRAADPAAVRAWAHACELATRQQAPYSALDRISLARFYSKPLTPGEPSMAVNAAQLAVGMRWISTPRLAVAFCDSAYPEHWHGMLSYYDFHRVGDDCSGLYAHDWRHTPVDRWLEKIGAREQATELQVDALALEANRPLMALSRAEFGLAVRDALRAFHRVERLTENALLQSRVVRDREPGLATVPTLRQLMRDAIAALQERPRSRKGARVLEATFLRAGTTQEAAAERLGLPFTTYRYQLGRGLEQITEWLWELEMRGMSS